MNVGDKIASLRKSKGWTQARLAQETGLSASAIAMYETNRRRPDESALGKIEQALGAVLSSEAGVSAQVTAQHAASEDVQPSPAPSGFTHLALTREEARVILFLRMNPRSKAFIDSYIVADETTRQQLEKTWRLIQDFRA